LLFTNDGDQAFDTWMAKAQPKRATGKRCVDCIGSEDFDLTFKETPFQKFGSETLYDYTPVGLTGDYSGYYGVYPGQNPSSFIHWKGCIQAWANGGLDKIVPQDKRNQNTSFWMWSLDEEQHLWALKDTKQANDESLWWNIEAQPDNVFARSGITFLSPLVIGFVSQKASFQGVTYEFDPQAFTALLGNQGGSLAGGWVGMLNKFGETKSSDDLSRLCFDAVDLDKRIGDVPPCSTVLNVTGAAALTGGSGLMITYMAWHGAKEATAFGRAGIVGSVVALCAAIAALKIAGAAETCK
jgi:hypothetical protein